MRWRRWVGALGRRLIGSVEGIHQRLQCFNVTLGVRSLKFLDLRCYSSAWAGVTQEQQSALGTYQVVIAGKSFGDNQPIFSSSTFRKLGWRSISVDGRGYHQRNNQANRQTKNEPGQQVKVGPLFSFHLSPLLSNPAGSWHQCH
jgi:hypothetical protein